MSLQTALLVHLVPPFLIAMLHSWQLQLSAIVVDTVNF